MTVPPIRYSTGAERTAKNRASGWDAGMCTGDPISLRPLIFQEIPQCFLMECELLWFLIHIVSFLNSTLFYPLFPFRPEYLLIRSGWEPS